jgi:BlaI family transcriptional regulator, penicillinase repressor
MNGRDLAKTDNNLRFTEWETLHPCHEPSVRNDRRNRLRESTKVFVDNYEAFRIIPSVLMKKPKLPKPTEGELAILRVLWQRGPSTVRDVWDQLNSQQQTGYTTVLKTMQIMLAKSLLERDEADRSHVYRPAIGQEETQRQLVSHFLDRVFAGSARKLVLQALSVKKTSPQELAEIRKLIDELERGEK